MNRHITELVDVGLTSLTQTFVYLDSKVHTSGLQWSLEMSTCLGPPVCVLIIEVVLFEKCPHFKVTLNVTHTVYND